MIKKLRAKFIFINMIIVTIMLIFIFSIVYVSTKNNLNREGIQMMLNIAKDPQKLPPPNGQPDRAFLPFFYVTVNDNNEIIASYGDSFDLSDTVLLQDIVNEAASSKEKVNTLKKYNLRYILDENEKPNIKTYIFSDTSNERNILNGLMINCLLIGAAAFIIFLIISIIFAKWAVIPVETAWKQQKQFVADASHELKTPLTVIQTNAELLNESGCTDSERTQLSSNIISMTGQMRGLVESMLELAKIDSGDIEKVMTHISLTDIVSESSMMFEPIFFENNLTFSYEIESDLEILGNETGIKQLADILLDNAIKYSSKGGHTLLSLKHTKTGKMLLCVSNEGDAIPQNELENLFKRFYRIDKSRSASNSYGLGLSIAESIVHEHHGKIWAESKDGYNSFYIEFPR